jgi:hypothetical protein
LGGWFRYTSSQINTKKMEDDTKRARKAEDDAAFAKEATTLMPWLKDVSHFGRKQDQYTYNQLLSLEENMCRFDKIWLQELADDLWHKVEKGMSFHPHTLHNELEYFRFITSIVPFVLHHKLRKITPEEFKAWQKDAEEDAAKERAKEEEAEAKAKEEDE